MQLKSARRRCVAVGLAATLVLAGRNLRRRGAPAETGPRRANGGGVALQLSEAAASDSSAAASSGAIEPSKACGCHRARANATCCQRAVLRAHKFGWLVTEQLFEPFAESIRRMPIRPASFPDDPSRDYRHAVIARNYPEAFVSGYLYHRSGRECWLTFNGWKRPESWGEKNIDWVPRVRRSGHDIGPYPPRDGRSICRYLADESEEVGMKVYIAAALAWHYDGLHEYLVRAKEREARDPEPRTLLLCLEDVSDPGGEERLFYLMMDWLYPGGHRRTFPQGVVASGPGRGGHATSHRTPPELRRRLLDLVRRYDRELFNGTLSRTNSLLGCNGTIHR